ncbi:MAG: mevalonate kinase [Saprospiraceae bacterium]|nr:mevalonate kinase [Saprospiraceae bacterium]
MSEKVFPGKIILFGEYTVLEGYRALAIPFMDVSGQWVFSEGCETRLFEYGKWLDHLSQAISWVKKSLVAEFMEDVGKGLCFQSSIPEGYGVGSSGAFVAALYHRYFQDAENDTPSILQEKFSLLESFFHGKSSGLDPLVSYTGSAILVDNKELQPLPLKSFRLPDKFTLVDTGISRLTGPIVQVFQEKKNDKKFQEEVLPTLGRYQELAIDAFLLQDWENLKENFQQISHLQYENFREMIPEEFIAEWKEGLSKGPYFKLCGAGGGGYLMKWQSVE